MGDIVLHMVFIIVPFLFHNNTVHMYDVMVESMYWGGLLGSVPPHPGSLCVPFLFSHHLPILHILLNFLTGLFNYMLTCYYYLNNLVFFLTILVDCHILIVIFPTVNNFFVSPQFILYFDSFYHFIIFICGCGIFHLHCRYGCWMYAVL